jgi:hypothetical protein
VKVRECGVRSTQKSGEPPHNIAAIFWSPATRYACSTMASSTITRISRVNSSGGTPYLEAADRALSRAEGLADRLGRALEDLPRVGRRTSGATGTATFGLALVGPPRGQMLPRALPSMATLSRLAGEVLELADRATTEAAPPPQAPAVATGRSRDRRVEVTLRAGMVADIGLDTGWADRATPAQLSNSLLEAIVAAALRGILAELAAFGVGAQKSVCDLDEGYNQ